jgi:hypothetical protein
MGGTPPEEGITLKETVIVVHGTFDGPVAGTTKWWQSGGSFCESLDAEFKTLGFPARCWAHCEGGQHSEFSWDGRNNWRSRYEAAIRLNEHTEVLRKDGWRCHLVAHSHGGNVVIRALHQEIAKYLLNRLNNLADYGISLSDYRYDDTWFRIKGLGEIVCLGTPFIDMPQFDFIWIGATGREEFRSNLVTLLGCVAAAAVSILLWIDRSRSDVIFKWFSTAVSGLLLAYAVWGLYQVVMLSVGILLLKSRHRDISSVQAEYRKAARPKQFTYWTHLLVQNSPHDEARILLKTFQASRLVFRTPIIRRAWADIRAQFIGFLRGTAEMLSIALRRRDARFEERLRRDAFQLDREMKAFVAQSAWVFLILLIASIYGGISWVSALPRGDILFLMVVLAATPLLVSPAGRSGIKSLLTTLVWPIRRLISAAILQTVAVPFGYDAARRAIYGLVDFPYNPEVVVDETPFWHSPDFFIYEELDNIVIAPARGRRQAWLDALLARLPAVASDGEMVGELLREIVGEPSFVHSTYYLAPENSARIARFIALRQ